MLKKIDKRKMQLLFLHPRRKDRISKDPLTSTLILHNCRRQVLETKSHSPTAEAGPFSEAVIPYDDEVRHATDDNAEQISTVSS